MEKMSGAPGRDNLTRRGRIHATCEVASKYIHCYTENGQESFATTRRRPPVQERDRDREATHALPNRPQQL